jgi:SpoVK/Ycf46/Vps4 family AAA+-type ATPase
VFDAAEHARAVLFFDEADALFGKRTEVSDAHDRYANLETAYLLARLERFDGMAVLATNLRTNIDPAFMRRMEFSLDFVEPDRQDRLRLWKAHIPDTAPLAKDVDLEEFAALFPIVGALIRNASVAAAFIAAGGNGSGEITRRNLFTAIRREYEKASRAFPTALLEMQEKTS